MTGPCTTPASFPSLCDYFAGDLPEAEQEALELHLLGCASCAAEAERVSGLTEALRASIPPVVGPEHLARLRQRGVRIVDNPMQPGEVKDVVFPRSAEVLLQRLCGLSLARATRVSLRLSAEHGGATMLELAEAPFDRVRGEVLVACQQHFASFPHAVVLEVRALDDDGREHGARYVVHHHFETVNEG